MTKSETIAIRTDTRAIDKSHLQPSTKAKYRAAWIAFRSAGVDLADHEAIEDYANGLSSSGRSFLKAAFHLMTAGQEQKIKAGVRPETVATAQAALWRLEAMRATVKVHKPQGRKVHNFLSAADVRALLGSCDWSTLEGKRDWIVLAVLVAAGLRRDELAGLTFDAVKQIPIRAGVRDVLQIRGKGDKYRGVPISAELGARLAEWYQVVGPGRVARSLGRWERIGESLDASLIFRIVRRHGQAIGKPTLAPHDLRRTFAELGRQGNIPMKQLSTLLGHASQQTTERYLNADLDLEHTASDLVPLSEA